MALHTREPNETLNGYFRRSQDWAPLLQRNQRARRPPAAIHCIVGKEFFLVTFFPVDFLIGKIDIKNGPIRAKRSRRPRPSAAPQQKNRLNIKDGNEAGQEQRLADPMQPEKNGLPYTPCLVLCIEIISYLVPVKCELFLGSYLQRRLNEKLSCTEVLVLPLCLVLVRVSYNLYSSL